MSCGNCGKNRRHIVDRGLPEAEKIKHTQEPMPVDGTNSYSFDSLLKMKEEESIEHKKHLRLVLSRMTEDAKAFYVVSLVRIINGEDFSIQGYNPEYCINLLHKMAGFEEMSFLERRFPGLLSQIESRYATLGKNLIKISGC